MPALIGLDMLHFAILKTDTPGTTSPEGEFTPGAATYDVPKRIIGARKFNINPNTEKATLFGDDGPMETAASLGDIATSMEVTDVPLDIQAEWYGSKVVNGAIIRNASDTPPFMAIGGRTLKSNGKYRYFWLLKGKQLLSEQNKATREQQIEYQTPTVTGAFVKRDCDGSWMIEYDEDSADFNPEVAKKWFTKVMEQADIVKGVPGV